MAWLTKKECKDCLETHILITENENLPKPDKKIQYTCPKTGNTITFFDHGKDKCDWESTVTLKVDPSHI